MSHTATTTLQPAPLKCDCLIVCGDDPRVVAGTAAKCHHHERLHRFRNNTETDAERFRFLCEHPDWVFMQRLCQRFPAQSASEFYQRRSAEIDRMRAAQ